MMRRASGGASVALTFAAAVLLAAAAALPGRGDLSWRKRSAAFERAAAEMTADPRLHPTATDPAFPPPAPFCRSCHPLPPHEGSGPRPAFLNHHATIMDCLVCHWARISGERPAPTWDSSAEAASLLRLSQPTGGGGRDVAKLRGIVSNKQQCFDRGPSCRTCHAPGKFDSYLRPGTRPAAARALEELPEFFTLAEGEKWYFPQR